MADLSDRDFVVTLLKRVQSGEQITAVARGIGVHRTSLANAFRRHGLSQERGFFANPKVVSGYNLRRARILAEEGEAGLARMVR